MNNVDVAAIAEAEALADGTSDPWTLVRAALDAIDPRLSRLTPEDTTAILDYIAWTARPVTSPPPAIPSHVWEMLTTADGGL